MGAIVLGVDHLEGFEGNPVVVLRVEQPFDVANQFPSCMIHASPDTEPFAANVYGGVNDGEPTVRLMGEVLHSCLSKNLGVKQLFEAHIGVHDTPAPIFVRVNTSATLPWEAVYHPTRRFLALDPQRRWPITRIAGTHPQPPARIIQLPLRVAAIFAAANLKALPEWQSHYDGLNAGHVDFQLHAFVAEQVLFDAITALHDPRVTVAWVPATDSDLMKALATIQPHLLHVLAHGFAGPDSYLEIATRAGHDGTADYQVYLGADHLGALADTLLLVVLNACRGANATKQVESLAYRLVCNGGVAAVIGMRDLIDTSDAHRFTRAFYGDAMARVAHALIPGSEVLFPWSEVLSAARAALRSQHAGPADDSASAHAEWTLPVLYVRHTNQPVKIAIPPAPVPADDRVRLQTERKLLVAAIEGASGTDAPAPIAGALRQRVAQIDAQLGG